MNLPQFFQFLNPPRSESKVTFPLDPKQLKNVDSDQVAAFEAYQRDRQFLDSLQLTLAPYDGQTDGPIKDLDTVKNGFLTFGNNVVKSERGTLEGGSMNLGDGSGQVKYQEASSNPLTSKSHWLTRQADGSIVHKSSLVSHPNRCQKEKLVEEESKDTYRVNRQAGTVTLHHQEWIYGFIL